MDLDLKTDVRASTRDAAYEQMEHNLTNHAPQSEVVIVAIEELRAYAKLLGGAIVIQCPPCIERANALTDLETTVMWAVAAIARNQDDMDPEAHG
jgi:hypothetical protein